MTTLTDKLKELAVVIPTHGRPHNQLAIDTMDRDVQSECVVFVCTAGNGDAEILRQKYPHVKIREANVKTIAEKRQWIMDNCKQKNKVIMIDDDITFRSRVPLQYRDPSTGYLKLLAGVTETEGKTSTVSTKEQVREMLEQVSILLDTYAHGGVESSQSNTLQESIFVENGIEWHENWRACMAVAYRVDIFHKTGMDFRKMPLREDMFVTVSLLEQGYANFSLLSHAAYQRTFGSAGGCTDERSIEKSNKCAVDLAGMFPGFIKAVEKSYSTGPDRTEVVVYWKKIYKAAVAKCGAKTLKET